MLLLCSDGLTSDTIMDFLHSKLSDQQNAALVVTADNQYKERNYHVKRCIEELERLGLRVELFDLDHQPAELLPGYDVVEFIGGNPFYLLHAIRENRCEAVIRELAARCILIGWSAAAFVFGPGLGSAELYTPEMNFMGLKDLRGLALTDLEILPHYQRFLHKMEGFEERCQQYERDHHCTVLRLDDGDGIWIGQDGTPILLCRK